MGVSWSHGLVAVEVRMRWSPLEQEGVRLFSQDACRDFVRENVVEVGSHEHVGVHEQEPRALPVATWWYLRICEVQLVEPEVVLLVYRVPITIPSPVPTEKFLLRYTSLLVSHPLAS